MNLSQETIDDAKVQALSLIISEETISPDMYDIFTNEDAESNFTIWEPLENESKKWLSDYCIELYDTFIWFAERTINRELQQTKE